MAFAGSGVQVPSGPLDIMKDSSEVEMLVKQRDIPALKGLFGLVFDELPTYQEIINGTPKLSLAYKLKEEFQTNKSLSVTLQRVEL